MLRIGAQVVATTTVDAGGRWIFAPALLNQNGVALQIGTVAIGDQVTAVLLPRLALPGHPLAALAEPGSATVEAQAAMTVPTAARALTTTRTDACACSNSHSYRRAYRNPNAYCHAVTPAPFGTHVNASCLLPTETATSVPQLPSAPTYTATAVPTTTTAPTATETATRVPTQSPTYTATPVATATSAVPANTLPPTFTETPAPAITEAAATAQTAVRAAATEAGVVTETVGVSPAVTPTTTAAVTLTVEPVSGATTAPGESLTGSTAVSVASGSDADADRCRDGRCCVRCTWACSSRNWRCRNGSAAHRRRAAGGWFPVGYGVDGAGVALWRHGRGASTEARGGCGKAGAVATRG